MRGPSGAFCILAWVRVVGTIGKFPMLRRNHFFAPQRQRNFPSPHARLRANRATSFSNGSSGLPIRTSLKRWLASQMAGERPRLSNSVPPPFSQAVPTRIISTTTVLHALAPVGEEDTEIDLIRVRVVVQVTAVTDAPGSKARCRDHASRLHGRHRGRRCAPVRPPRPRNHGRERNYRHPQSSTS